MTPLIDDLMQALRCLPGVGPKTAQRMALHLLQRDRQGGKQVVRSLQACLDTIVYCQRCRSLSETTICQLCQRLDRQSRELCVVESPADVLAIEQTASYQGQYFVLMGHLSPLDGIGPSDIGLHVLEQRLHEGVCHELIIATGTTVEGEATAHFIADMAKKARVRVTRIAYGIPSGGELEYIDGVTLARAMSGRSEVT